MILGMSEMNTETAWVELEDSSGRFLVVVDDVNRSVDVAFTIAVGLLDRLQSNLRERIALVHFQGRVDKPRLFLRTVLAEDKSPAPYMDKRTHTQVECTIEEDREVVAAVFFDLLEWIDLYGIGTFHEGRLVGKEKRKKDWF